jgi:NAD/NADP transhydrogenase alpha subunit
VSGSERETRDGAVIVDVVAEQGGNRIIRNAEAELQAL